MLLVGPRTSLKDGSIPNLVCRLVPYSQALTPQKHPGGHPDRDGNI